MADKACKPAVRFPRKADLPDPIAPCPNAALAAHTRNVENLDEPGYWQAVCEELTVNGAFKGSKPLKRQEQIERDLKQQINTEGVCQVGPQFLQWPFDMNRLARNMAILMQHGWPPTFLLMYDEVWALIHRASSLMASTTGNACNMDVLCWWVDPNRGDAGFSPHRDRQPDDSPATFRPGDGSAMYSTCWVPLTDACPENSCLYMVPRWADPGYFAGDDDGGPDPLTVALAAKEAFQSIRAFPAEAGSAIIFTHRIIHWGSRGRKGYHTPRLAVSWGCADDAYEPSYFNRKHLPYPPMALRAALACGQMLAYHERFVMTKRQLSLYYKFFMAHAAEFHQSYVAKVKKEFVAASKEAASAAAPTTPLAAPPPAAAAAAGSNGQIAAANGAQVKRQGTAEVDTASKKAKKAKKGRDGGRDGAAAGGLEPAVATTKETGSESGAKAAAVATQPQGKGKEVVTGKKQKEKKRAADVGNTTAGPDAGGVDSEGAAAAGVKTGKKANKAVVKDAAGLGAKQAVGKAPSAATEQLAAPVVAAAKQKPVQTGKDGKGKDKVNAAVQKAAPPPKRLSSDDDDDDDDEEAEEGWEGLLAAGAVGGGDSEDDLMEDALDAMLDAELAGDVEGLQDDFDDFAEDM